MGPEFTQINHKKIGVGCWSGHLAQAQHPCGLNPNHAAEGRARVQIGPARLMKIRGNLGVAAHDDGHPRAREENRQRAYFSDEIRDHRRQAKDPAADDGVDRERNQAPAADGADESRCAGWRGFYHRGFVS